MNLLTKIVLYIAMFLLTCTSAYAQTPPPPPEKALLKEDLDQLLDYVNGNYVYLPERKVDITCLRSYYTAQLETVKTHEDAVLLFEYFLDEFHDSHVMLNTNVWQSYRLNSAIYASLKGSRAVITSVWLSGIEGSIENISGAEILKINGTDLSKAIAAFPTHCNDKTDTATREWIINKIISGRYSEPRILTLKLTSGRIITFDLDKVKIRKNKELLTADVKDNIGIITLNNSLGNNILITEFDKALDKLKDTKGLIIDLRNTVDGGNTYVARGIMGHFTTIPKPYQKHSFDEQYNGGPAIQRSWLEYVTPRGGYYSRPIVILVGRWTGSMGEGFTIGMESVANAIVMGTEMERLAGEMAGFPFKHQNFGARLSTARLFHVNGTPREQYIPKNYVQQTTTLTDETLNKALELLK
jgi:carboxyl-terminal processing protease